MTAKDNYWSTVFKKRVSRRTALSAAMSAGLGYAGLGLLGCQSGRKAADSAQPTSSAGTSSLKMSKIPVPSGEPKYGGVLKNQGYAPVHWDPNQTSSGYANMNFSRIYDPLTSFRIGPKYDAGDYTIEPWLAEKWEQPDPQTYVFQLRKGVKFHNIPPVNGRELTSEDVKYTYQRIGDPKTGNPELRYRVQEVSSIDTPDKYTAKFKLGKPVASFLMFTAGAPLLITPRESVEKYGDLKKAESCIGTGPWMLDKFEPNVRVSFKKNPDFWIKGKPYMDGLDTLMMPDASTRIASLRTGALDSSSVGRTDLDSLKQTNPEILYDEFWQPVFVRITFRLDKPPFNDVRVRRAVALALDFDAYIKSNLLGVGQRVGPLHPGHGAWFLPFDQDPASAQWYNYNPEEAKKLLAEAGYPNGFETSMFGTPYYGPAMVEAMEMVSSYLDKIGIKAKIELKEYAAHMATTFVGNFEGMAGPMATHTYADPDYFLYGFFYPGMPTNHGNLSDPELNKMLEKMMVELNNAERTKVIHDIQKRIRDNVYNIALPSSPAIFAVQPWVKNFVSMNRVQCVGNWGKETIEAWMDKK